MPSAPQLELCARTAFQQQATAEALREVPREVDCMVIRKRLHVGEGDFVLLRRIQTNRHGVDETMRRQCLLEKRAQQGTKPQHVPGKPDRNGGHGAEGRRAAEDVLQVGCAAAPMADYEERRGHRRLRPEPRRDPDPLHDGAWPAAECGCDADQHLRQAGRVDRTIAHQRSGECRQIGTAKRVQQTRPRALQVWLPGVIPTWRSRRCSLVSRVSQSSGRMGLHPLTTFKSAPSSLRTGPN
jgi:hypothetical protein